MVTFLKQMLQLLLSPTKGWEDVAAQRVAPRDALRHGLLPLVAVAALSVFAKAIYMVEPSFADLLVGALITVVQFGLTYVAGLVILTAYLPKITADGTVDTARLDLFLTYSVGLMACISVVSNLLPVELAPVQLLPLFVAVVMWQARPFLSISPDATGRYVGVSVLSVIVPVYLFDMLLKAIL